MLRTTDRFLLGAVKLASAFALIGGDIGVPDLVAMDPVNVGMRRGFGRLGHREFPSCPQQPARPEGVAYTRSASIRDFLLSKNILIDAEPLPACYVLLFG
jgi:hypothetical protein